MEKHKNQFVRCDDFIDHPVKVDNPIQETWIHKEVVQKTGEGDDEFVIIHKPFCIERIDLDKRIHEEAKGTDLKSLISQVLRTGDVNLLNQKQGVYVDITGYPEDTITAMNNLVRGNDVLGNLPEDLKGMKLEDLINMSNEDIGNYVKDKISKAVEASKPNVKPKEDTEIPEPNIKEVKKEGE